MKKEQVNKRRLVVTIEVIERTSPRVNGRWYTTSHVSRTVKSAIDSEFKKYGWLSRKKVTTKVARERGDTQ